MKKIHRHHRNRPNQKLRFRQNKLRAAERERKWKQFVADWIMSNVRLPDKPNTMLVSPAIEEALNKEKAK